LIVILDTHNYRDPMPVSPLVPSIFPRSLKGKQARAIYCYESDSLQKQITPPTGSPISNGQGQVLCNTDPTTNNSCLDTAYVDMEVLHTPDGYYAYRWRQNVLPIGRPRDFVLMAYFN
jgi:hypothetical protein